jgi:hypothetical protein
VIGIAKPLQALDRGRLPGSVRAEQAEDLALLDREGHVVDRHRVPVGLVEGLDRDHRRHGTGA